MEVMKEAKAKAKGTAMTTKAMKVVGSGQRSSVFRGVTRHRWTGRYEAHLWDNTCRREGQKRKGRQVYLGGYDKEEKAARAYDLAALKYWGPSAPTNFPVDRYYNEIEIMQNMTKQEFIASIRRNSSGFSRGASVYRGVTRHHQQGRWQARIGRVAGNKDLYLGTFGTEAEAAEAYDVAAIKFRGCNAVTNFALSRYNVEAIANSELPVGTSAKRMQQQKALQPKTSMTAITSTELSTRALPERTKQSAHGNNSPFLTITSVNKTICNWATGNFQTNGAPQQTMESSNALEHPNNDPYASVHNLFQLQSSTVDQSSISLAYYNMDDASSDPCGQNFCWPLVNSQHTRQVHCGTLAQGTELLRLTS
ncbi:uncharacterized protein A4U43_C07F12240 [Asparagus officinalis]|uniref:AP2/ERF domain-containing protein n=1 Tax=Asparagus officinalis TaxID=4686 RepID=A0A5P1EEP2_ASPOF|nr:AP2-like ethylene-responsive transcription factor AIL7 [Asparagus officinalis]ONK63181.1 uncharacterized protein A4U43_C07F12240 [Asparagus officinalis]